MNWTYIIFGMIAGLVILVPLGRKWDIDLAISLCAALGIGFLSGILGNILEAVWGVEKVGNYCLQIPIIVGMALGLIAWRFYRDPERSIPTSPGSIVSPADGKIIYIKKAENGDLTTIEKKGMSLFLKDIIPSDILKGRGTLIGISMNFLDVHVNRAPIEGSILVSRGIKGLFLSLRREEAVWKNEKRVMIIKGKHISIAMIQIASRLVRSIVSYINEGQEVMKGQRIGMIRFGSQVDLYIPDTLGLKIHAFLGQKVKAGMSVIAQLTAD